MTLLNQKKSILSYFLGDISELPISYCLKKLNITEKELNEVSKKVNIEGKKCLSQIGQIIKSPSIL